MGAEKVCMQILLLNTKINAMQKLHLEYFTCNMVGDKYEFTANVSENKLFLSVVYINIRMLHLTYKC